MEMVMPNLPADKLEIQHQRGFSLIEALFSALILGIALLGLAGFHAVALKDGSLVKARSAAANLAQEKLDDLRSFTRLEGDATACGAGTFCFSEIAPSTADVNIGGGQENGTALVLPSGAPAIAYTDNYSLAWDVTCSAEAPGAALSFGSTCTDATAKLVTVTTSWTDSKGANQLVSLQSVIYGLDPSRLALAAGPAFSGQLPKKPAYTPVGVPDAVPVPINTGGTQFKESSKPLPEVSQSGDGIEVSFDSVVYSSVTGGYEKDSQEEFSTVGCECQFNSGTAEAYTPTRKIWNGAALVTKVGAKVAKVTGQPLGNSPPAHCDICCRDHHDRDMSSDPKYDPQRPDSDYTAGDDHKHYWYKECVDGGVGDANCTAGEKDTSLSSDTPLYETSSGAYLETCRVGRVDGYWQVLQDWRLRKVTILPYHYLLNTTNLNNYVDVVEKVVESAVKSDSGVGPVTVPSLSGRDLTLASGAAPVQLLSRAVYVDTIYQKDNPSTVDSAYYTALLAKISASQSANNSAWLDYAPFYEANLTLLYDWTASEPSIATVSSERIDAIVDPANNYYGSFSRGKVRIQSGESSGDSVITARARLSNTGVTGGVNRSSTNYLAGVSFGTDVHDTASSLEDTITIHRSASGLIHSITGKVIKGNSSVNVRETGSPASPITVALTPIAGQVISPCTVQTGDSDVNAWYYTCTVSDGFYGTLRLSSAGSVYTFVEAFTGAIDMPVIDLAFATLVDRAWTMQDVVAYGAYVTLTGDVIPVDFPSGGLKPYVTVSNTTLTYNGTVEGVTASGTCTSKALVGLGSNLVLRYSCVVPKGWTGAVTASVDPSGGAYTYRSPSDTPCTGLSTSASCTMATVTSALDDIDGTSSTATTLQRQQTNVYVRR